MTVGMDHSGMSVKESMEAPCPHHAMDTASLEDDMIVHGAPTNKMPMCDMCALCISIVPAMPQILQPNNTLQILDVAKTNNVFSSFQFALDKPPRP